MTIFRIIYCCYFFCLLSTSVIAQHHFARLHQTEGSFRDANIHIGFERASGILVFGSDQGLLSYDGISFDVIPFSDSIRLAKITAIGEDKDHHLWLGFANGAIFKEDIQTNKLIPWIIEEGWPNQAITGFAFDQEDNMWFGTYGEGVYSYRQGHLYNFDQEDKLPALDVYTIVNDENGNILVGTDGGLSICTWEGKNKRVETFGIEKGLTDIIVRSIVPIDKQSCWIGTYEGGPILFDLNSKTFHSHEAPWPGYTISCMALSPNKQLWIGTEEEGIIHLSKDQKNYTNPLHTNKVYDLIIDREGNAWTMAPQQGLRSYNLRLSYFKPNLTGIQAVLQSQSKKLWLGTNKGLYHQENLSNKEKFGVWPDLSANIISLFEDKFGYIWIGTFGDGLFILNPFTKQLHKFGTPNGLTNDNILSIYGLENELWLGTLGGVFHFKYTSDFALLKSLKFQHGLSDDQSLAAYIYAVNNGSEGKIWLGTDGDGLSYWEDGLVSQLDQFPSLINESVYSISKGSNNSIWFNCSSLGLHQLSKDSLRHQSLPDQIRPKEIVGLWTDLAENLYIIHQTGISIWSEKEQTLSHFNEEIGLAEFQPSLNAIHPTNDNLLVASDSYVVCLNLDFPATRIQPQPIIKDVSAGFQSLSLARKRPLAAHQNNLSFSFSGLWYTDPDAVQYRYRLSGFDHDWIETVDQQVVYSQLPPGNYTFQLAASNDGSFSSAKIEEFSFTLLAPLWQRWWFILLSILVIVGGLYYFIKLRERQVQRTAALKKDSIESKYETLKSQINPHFLFNSFNTLVTIIEEEPTLAVTYVERLADFYRSILQYREQELIPLSEELQIVADYHFLLKERYGDNLIINIPPNGREYLVAPLSLQMLCENAVKHNVIGRLKPLTIDIQQDEQNYIWVKNNLQPKIVSTKSTGLGLQNISSRYSLLTHSPVNIEKTDTCFQVGIPLISLKN